MDIWPDPKTDRLVILVMLEVRSGGSKKPVGPPFLAFFGIRGQADLLVNGGRQELAKLNSAVTSKGLAAIPTLVVVGQVGKSNIARFHT